jgi:hypothetical protein
MTSCFWKVFVGTYNQCLNINPIDLINPNPGCAISFVGLLPDKFCYNGSCIDTQPVPTFWGCPDGINCEMIAGPDLNIAQYGYLSQAECSCGGGII